MTWGPPAQEAIWQWWNQGTYLTSAATTQTTTWQNWTSNATSTSAITTTWTGWNERYEETREQAERRKEREREQARLRAERERVQAAAHAARMAERQVACARAEELLLSLLTDEQAASYAEHGWFEVRGSRGGRWRIRRRGQAGNVDLMPEIGDVRVASYCCHPPGGLPPADAHAAQMLHLVTDEDGFKRVANLAYSGVAA